MFEKWRRNSENRKMAMIMQTFIEESPDRRVAARNKAAEIAWTISADGEGNPIIEQGPAYGQKVTALSLEEKEGRVVHQLPRSGRYARFLDRG